MKKGISVVLILIIGISIFHSHHSDIVKEKENSVSGEWVSTEELASVDTLEDSSDWYYEEDEDQEESEYDDPVYDYPNPEPEYDYDEYVPEPEPTYPDPIYEEDTSDPYSEPAYTPEEENDHPEFEEPVYIPMEPESSYYYWNVLTENEQAVYDQVLYAIQIVDNEGFEPVAKVSGEQVERIFWAVELDHPELFWFGRSEETRSSGDEIVWIRPCYNALADHLEENQTLFHNKRDEVLSQVEGLSTEETVCFVHDYLIENINYEHDAYDQTCWGLVSGQGVCATYSKVFCYLLKECGIDATVCTGVASNASGETDRHAWNTVKMDDGQYYNVDVTFDSRDHQPVYEYFLKSDTVFEQNHDRDDIYDVLPACWRDYGGE